VASFDRAEEVINTVAVNVSVSGSHWIAPSIVEEFPGAGMEVTISEGWSDEMQGTDVAHHVNGFSMG